MKNKNRLMPLAVAALMALSGCAGTDSTQTTAEKTTAAQTTAEATTQAQTEAQTTEEAPETTTEEVSDTLPIADNAVTFAANLKLGWNLGNTLDATGGTGLNSETSWGQPVTTPELINYVKEAGFTSIRIPVSWGKHCDSDYNVDAEWMARVTEVVDYAIDADLYVILNSHHDCDFYYPSAENAENGAKYIETLWSQIAEQFKDYDERLIFESMNEPRLTGTSKEWWFSSSDSTGNEAIDVICNNNQVFVDTVRSAGGYNETRYLMVPGYAASPGLMYSSFHMPTDPSERLILSIHAYTPYNFAMNYSGGTDKWTSSQVSELNFMDTVYKNYVAKGYGVVIGEFGATNKNNLEDRVAWATDYTSKASSLGISCFLWDNGGTNAGDENFGMINRYSLYIYYPELLDAMLASYK
ncbi:MAG: glycoside hydrolase family 5 protein [Lachnospiraceae bacterium]|nr:glycoside hydrolase family 5 protein [Lachnospiraceae bacterium]